MQMLRALVLLSMLWCCATSLCPETTTAGVFTSGCASQSACTLSELISGGVITAGGTRFDSWEIEQDPGTVDFTQIVVEGLGDGALDPGPGLRIRGNGQLELLGAGELDLRFGFKAASIYPNFRIRDNRLVIGAASTNGTGQVAVDENVFDDSFRLLAWKDGRVDPAFGEVRTVDSAQFGTQVQLFIEKDILLEGRAAGDEASLDTLIQRFSQATVPEPGLALGLGAGLAGLAVVAGRRSRPASRPVAATLEKGP